MTATISVNWILYREGSRLAHLSAELAQAQLVSVGPGTHGEWRDQVGAAASNWVVYIVLQVLVHFCESM